MADPIEIMARAINSADPVALPGHFHDRAVAWLVIKALDSAGYAIVPKEPTITILSAGCAASNSYPAVPPGHVCEPVHEFVATQMYRAQIKAGRVKP